MDVYPSRHQRLLVDEKLLVPAVDSYPKTSTRTVYLWIDVELRIHFVRLSLPVCQWYNNIIIVRLFFGFSYIVQLFDYWTCIRLILSWLKRYTGCQIQNNNTEGRTQIMMVHRIEMIWCFFTMKAIRTDFHLPALPFWKKFGLNSDSIVTELPHPHWSRRQRWYWNFLGISIPSAVRPHYLTKGWLSVHPSDQFMTTRGKCGPKKKGSMENNLLNGQFLACSHAPGT